MGRNRKKSTVNFPEVDPAAVQFFDSSRNTTDVTGAITEFQKKQLSMWPLVVIKGADPSETKAMVNIGRSTSEPDDAGNMHRNPRAVKVVYDCRTLSGKADKTLPRAAGLLEEWTKYMFWPNTTVQVIVDGKTIRPDSSKDK